MKRGILWLSLSCLMIAAMLLSSCKTTPTTTTVTTTTTATTTTTSTTAATTTTTTETEMVKDFMGRLVEKPVYGGTLVSHFSAFVGSADPGDGGSSDVGGWMGMTFESIGIGDWSLAGAGTNEYFVPGKPIDYNKAGKGQLAESWEMTDPTTLTVHIRHGIYFQNKAPVNGRELTGEDVRYCYQRYYNSTTAPFDARAYLASITLTDKWTVVFKFKQPYCMSVLSVCYGPVMVYPPELITTYGNLKDWHNWVGTGPFIMKDYVEGSSGLFVRNDNYWGYDEIIPGNRLPYLDAIRYLVIPDVNTQLAALRTGKIDVKSRDPLSPENYATLKSTAAQVQYAGSIEGTCRPLVIYRMDKAPFNDLRVRRALVMAMDFKGIIKNYLGGEGTDIIFPVLPSYGDCYVSLEQMPADVQENYSYNVTKAKELLTAAGFPTGFDVELQSFPGDEDHCAIIANYWKAIGLKVTITTPDLATTYALLFGKAYKQTAVLPAGIGYPISCLGWPTSTHVWDLMCYKNPAYDDLYVKLMATTDPDQQNEIMRQLQIMLYSDAVLFTFPGRMAYTCWQPWVKHYHGEVSLSDTRGAAQVLARLWVDQKMKTSMGY